MFFVYYHPNYELPWKRKEYNYNWLVIWSYLFCVDDSNLFCILFCIDDTNLFCIDDTNLFLISGGGGGSGPILIKMDGKKGKGGNIIYIAGSHEKKHVEYIPVPMHMPEYKHMSMGHGWWWIIKMIFLISFRGILLCFNMLFIRFNVINKC